MIRIGDKYINGAAVQAIVPASSVLDANNWSSVLMQDGTWLQVNAPAAVVVDRIALAEACSDIRCTEDHDG